MWLYMIAAVLLVFGIVGGVFGGGILTIVLVPLAAIAVGTAIASAMLARSHEAKAAGSTDATPSTGRPLPRNSPRPSGRAPTSPERLVDARREQQ